MEEQDWVAGIDPHPMIELLSGRASERKVRLFMCACCRHVWHKLTDERSRKAVEAAERYADGKATLDELQAAGAAAETVYAHWAILFGHPSPAECAGATTSSHIAFTGRRHWFDLESSIYDSIKPACTILREIFGNPFRPVAVDPAWLTWNHATVPAIARHVYDDRAFHDLPILADALEDAGCTDPDILAHCRGGGEHVRGCWVVDLLLGKS